MPLDRDHLTVASRIMVPTYVVFFSVVGSNFLFGPSARLQSPMLRYADTLMDIHIWGGLFLGCGLLMLTAMWLRNRDMYRYGLIVCALSMATWALVAVLGIFAQPISFSAWAWPGAMTAACLATNRSLVRDRRQPIGD